MRAIKFLVMISFCLMFTAALSQVLDTRVSLEYKNTTIENILKDISKNYNINFSYSTTILPMNKSISIEIKDAPLGTALNNVFKGTEITYQVVGSSIVLTKSSKKEPEKSRIKKASSSIDSSRSKEEKVSESLETSVVKQPVIIESENVPEVTLTPPSFPSDEKDDTVITKENLKKQYHTERRKLEKEYYKKLDSLEQSGDEKNKQNLKSQFHHLLREMKEGLNTLSDSIENFNWHKSKPSRKKHEADSAFANSDTSGYLHRSSQITFIPPMSTNGMEAPGCVNKVSLNILGGVAAGVEGFEGGSIFNIDKAYVHGAQVSGIINVAGENVKGAQLAGLLNLSGRDVKGGQFAGFMNIAGNKVKGVQSAGFLNISGNNIKGAQLAGFMNIAPDTISGVQVAGFMNVANKVKGSQIGFLNFADSVSGAQIGFLSFSKKGYRKLELWTSETLYGNIAFKTGTYKFYNILAVGGQPSHSSINYWGYGYGIGTQMSLSKKILFNLEGICFSIHHNGFEWNELNLLNQLKLNIGISLTNNISLFAGPTINVMASNHYNKDSNTYGSPIVPSHTLYAGTDNKTNTSIWIGYNAGIRF